ncbi:splicing factor 45 [Daktulosphaira vitifoliae]|uniref:splicing factor 45 n=1 Tax=Daktulosphaira vitifoliae TaxID=58002 RepID=UPI0021AA9126|nr:splicing factor 45 [Daktulosphaira vitifoliae]
MSLYDDFDAVKQKSDGWSSGMKLFQSQMQLKKAAQTQPRREAARKTTSVLAPVIDLKKKDDDDPMFDPGLGFTIFPLAREGKKVQRPSFPPMDWPFDGIEYDPMIPNDYERVVRDLRDMRDKEKEKEDEERRKRREERNKNRDSFNMIDSVNMTPSNDERRKTGFAGRKDSDSDEEDSKPVSRVPGAAIAPPPSLQESIISSPGPQTPSIGVGMGVAAKIMAKYGFKEGQGLGKKEQGISVALQVEKTSKRGGRIIHEKPGGNLSPPMSALIQDDFVAPAPPPPKPLQSITEIMKVQSKVVLLRNMVGPGEVDQDLEPEVKDECNTKYGDVNKVLIYELPDVDPEEAVRIFVEFKRIESAIKAVVDLNGRFFGGRQVKAGFYDVEKFNSYQLLD